MLFHNLTFTPHPSHQLFHPLDWPLALGSLVWRFGLDFHLAILFPEPRVIASTLFLPSGWSGGLDSLEIRQH